MIRFGFLNLLHAADINAHFPGRFDHLVEQMTDHLVTIGGDADRFAGLHKRTDHARADMCLACARRALNRKDTAIERRCDP